jgi:lipid II:glycine glycyltransferase (peptidoglycan interpeptide bridge formation enzyme)
LVKLFVGEIKKIGKEAGCSFVRVRPQLESNEISQKLFKSVGFVNAPMHLHAELTLQLSLDKTEEEILSNMRKNTRYEVKKAILQNIKIEKTTDSKSIKDFYNIQISVSKKKNFVPFSYKFLLEQFKVFAKNDRVLLITAKLGKDVLAQAFIIFYGNEAVYHYGVTTEAGRKYPGAYLIQWEAIKEAKKRGMRRYNSWGVAPETNKSHRFYSLSVFKRGFGGREFEYLRAQDLVLDRKRYIINYLIETIRKKLRGV